MGSIAISRDFIPAFAFAWETELCVVVREIWVPSGSWLVIGVEGASQWTAGLGTTGLGHCQ